MLFVGLEKLIVKCIVSKHVCPNTWLMVLKFNFQWPPGTTGAMENQDGFNTTTNSSVVGKLF